MVPAVSSASAAFHLATIDSKQGLDLVDVEGDLESGAMTRWSGLLQGAINDGATGIAVDLRGCRVVDPLCLSAMVAASAILKRRGGGGVRMVSNPESPLGRTLRTDAGADLPSSASAMGALLSLGEAQ
jgi:anti-anti-sigma regulatory factor